MNSIIENFLSVVVRRYESCNLASTRRGETSMWCSGCPAIQLSVECDVAADAAKKALAEPDYKKAFEKVLAKVVEEEVYAKKRRENSVNAWTFGRVEAFVEIAAFVRKVKEEMNDE